MGKRMSALLASTMTVIGLTAGVAPAHAAPDPEPYSGVVYAELNFEGPFALLPYSLTSCAPLHRKYTSAENKSKIFTIRLYDYPDCKDSVSLIPPGTEDSGYVTGFPLKTHLGVHGAYYYSISLF